MCVRSYVLSLFCVDFFFACRFCHPYYKRPSLFVLCAFFFFEHRFSSIPFFTGGKSANIALCNDDDDLMMTGSMQVNEEMYERKQIVSHMQNKIKEEQKQQQQKRWEKTSEMNIK